MAVVAVRYIVSDLDPALTFIGVGGTQALLEDPSGNLIELFEPKQAAHA